MNFFVNIFFKGSGIVIWIQQKLNAKQFLIFSAILIGLSAGLAAVLLKYFVHFILRNSEKLSGNEFIITSIFPLFGILLCTLYIRYFNNNKLGKGISNILYSIAKKSSILPKDQTYSHIITSALTVGLGGSAGLESPIVTTGSAIGSNFGRIYQLTYKERTLLLACGAAAGIAGAFNTPIAGVLFALEVLLVEANISAFIPILIASASAALCSKIIMHEDILLQFKLQEVFNYKNVPFYFLLGIIAGATSYYYAKVFLATENFLKRFEKQIYLRAVLGGLGLFVLILSLPPLFGEGYGNIKLLSTQNIDTLFKNSFFAFIPFSKPITYLFLLLVLLVKPIASGLTIGSGGNGGNFAPSLFMGAFLGFLFSSIINELGFTNLPVSNFTLVAMGGILSGIFHAPLTGIFLIAEITGGYELIIPLMIVSALSYATSKYFMPLSIDLTKLSEKEKIDVNSTDSYLLSSIDLEKLIQNNFPVIAIDQKLGDIITIVSATKANIFPVLDKNGALKGVIKIDNLREVMFNQEYYEKLSAKALMHPPGYKIRKKDNVHSVMKMFDESDYTELAVVYSGEYRGFIFKADLLEKYRELLVRSSIE